MPNLDAKTLESVGRYLDLASSLGKLIATETEKWGKVVKFANIKPE